MATVPHAVDSSYYALRPRTPARAWALAFVAVVGGIGLLTAGWRDPRSTAMIVVGALIALAGLVLAVTTAAFMTSRTVHIVLSPDGFEVNGPGYDKSGSWIDVDSVSATPDGSRLVIASGRVHRTYIQCPGGEADERMAAITADIARRLHALES